MSSRAKGFGKLVHVWQAIERSLVELEIVEHRYVQSRKRVVRIEELLTADVSCNEGKELSSDILMLEASSTPPDEMERQLVPMKKRIGRADGESGQKTTRENSATAPPD